jgi:CHAT domain-containing protein
LDSRVGTGAKSGRQVSRTLLLLTLERALLAYALLVPVELRAGCNAMLDDQRAVYEGSVDVRGRDRVTRAVRIPAGAEIIIFARERGVDVTLEVSSAGRVIGRADNPISRTGIQRVIFAARGEAEYSVSLVGKEQAGSSGAVDIRVLSDPAKTDACVDVQRLIAAADAAYATGQAVSRGLATESGVDASSAYRSAASEYKNAATRLQGSGPSLLLAQSQHSVASVLNTDLETDAAEAKSWASKAVQNYGAVGDAYGAARAQEIEAYALFQLAVSPQSPSQSTDGLRTAQEGLASARALLDPLVAFHAQRGDAYQQANVLNTIGLTYYEEGANDQAIKTFRRALTLYEGLGDNLGRAKVLHNTALAQSDLGRLSEAADLYAQVLKLITPKDDPYGFTYVLIANGVASRASGDLDEALQRFGEALELARSIQNVSLQGRALYGIGSVYDTIGDADLALDFYQQALPLRRAESEGPGRIATLSAIANILRERGRAAESLKMDREALSLTAAPITAARIRVQIARDLLALEQPNEALQEVQAVLAAGSGANEIQKALALFERSRTRISTGDLQRAESDLRSALRIFKQYEAPAHEFGAWVMLAELKRQQGQTDQALVCLDKALALAEEVRTQSANPELRATVMQPLRPAFDLKITLLAERYFVSAAGSTTGGADAIAMQALLTAEQARARAMSDFQNLDVAVTDAGPERLQKRETLYRDLAAHRFRLESMLDDVGADDPRIANLRGEIATLRQQLDRINAEINTASAAGRSRSAQNQATSDVDLKSVPADTAIVEYWLGSEDALAWVVTREKLAMVRIGATRDISDAARSFHTALRSYLTVPAAERLKLAERLHDLIMQPVAARVSNKRTLIFAPDGALHYVPFAALRYVDGGRRRFMVETHDVAVTPSIRFILSTSDSAQDSQPRKQMLLVDDPVYESTDSRIALASASTTRKEKSLWAWPLVRGPSKGAPLPRLPGTGREAATIASLLPKDTVDQLEGFEATRDRFLRARLGQYRFIHVASHAVTDSELPQLSSLILSTIDRQGRPLDGRVMAADFINMRLHADVVVLSACDTALGANVAGEGLIGLRYVVLARGARSVLASLWQVPDEPTVTLMTRFYSSLLHDKSSLISASSSAMRAMLESKMTDPGWWAAFALTVRE